MIFVLLVDKNSDASITVVRSKFPILQVCENFNDKVFDLPTNFC